MVERMRELSRIFEPHQKVDPYRHLVAIASPLDAALADLPDVADKADAAAAVQHLLQGAAEGDRGRKERNRIVRAGLDLAPRVGEEFALEMLKEAVALYDSQAETSDPNLLIDQIVPLLEKALFVAAHFDSAEQSAAGGAVSRSCCSDSNDAPELRTLDAAANQCFRGLRKLGMRDEVNQLLQQTADAILGGQDLNDAAALARRTRKRLTVPAVRRRRLAAFRPGRQGRAGVAGARGRYSRNELDGKEQSALACAYVAAVGQAPPETAQKRMEEVFEARGKRPRQFLDEQLLQPIATAADRGGGAGRRQRRLHARRRRPPLAGRR